MMSAGIDGRELREHIVNHFASHNDGDQQRDVGKAECETDGWPETLPIKRAVTLEIRKVLDGTRGPNVAR